MFSCCCTLEGELAQSPDADAVPSETASSPWAPGSEHINGEWAPELIVESRVVLQGVEYDIALQKAEGQSLGLRLEALGGRLRVEEVLEGVFKAFNETATGERRVRDNSFFLAVNGVTDIPGMVGALKQSETLKVRVARPTQLVVSIDKSSKPLGLEVEQEETCSSLFVKSVQAGAAQEYNRGVKLAHRVQSGDFIIEVNGVGGVASELREAILAAERVELRLLRPRSVQQ